MKAKIRPEDYAWLGEDFVNDYDAVVNLLPTLNNPLINKNVTEKYRDNFSRYYAKQLRKPMYFSSLCQNIFNIRLLPIQDAILQELWAKPFPMFIASRGFGKSFLLALYATLKCFLIPESKIVIAGAGFRQSKIIFEYMANIWKKAPIFRQLIGSKSKPSRDIDRCTMNILDSWAVAIPIGTGDKIRGLRAHTIMADEFAAINPSIYETVISGFAAVSKDPVDNVALEARIDFMEKHGLMNEELNALLSQSRQTNQSIISGTADYAFQHFAKYHKRYHDIIASRGDEHKLKELFKNEDGTIQRGQDWRDYSIIRVPYEIIPKGFMDEKTVMRAKATMHSAIYQMEYGCVFVEDSQGFFRRTLIDKCMGTEAKPIECPESGKVWFDAMTKGSPKKRYVLGIDPASESNNFTIVILEVNKDHFKVAYCWSTNRKKFYAEKKYGKTDENDFYVYCCRKIRSLMALFPCARIGLDSQGGGRTIEQGLHSKGSLKQGEKPIYEIIDKENKKPTDRETDGPHIVELVNFADAEWTSNANNGLKKAMEVQELIFPRFDKLAIAISNEQDKAVNIARENAKEMSSEEQDELHMILNMDSMEECVIEIEELKNELSTIEMKSTLAGRDRWSTPEIVENGKKSKLNKDRYSALLMAYMMAVQVQAGPQLGIMATIGRLAKSEVKTQKTGTIVDFYRSIPKRGV